ncbi:MAG: PKD domain-containing protein [Algisphaera sp.]
MKSRSKKLRQSSPSRKQTPREKREVFKAPVFENLEERQLMSGAMYVGTNLAEIVPSELNVNDRRYNSSNRTHYYNVMGAGTTPFNDLMKHAQWKRGSGGAPVLDNGKPGSYISVLSGNGSYTLRARAYAKVKIAAIGGSQKINGQASATITLNNSASTVRISGGGNRMLFRVTLLGGSVNSSKVSLIKHGRRGTFDPTFTNDLAIYNNGTLRYMDWGQTNHNKIRNWSGRPTTSNSQGEILRWNSSETQANRGVGVAIENMVALSNQTNKNAWFTVPARATDAYVRSMAGYIKRSLKTNLKAFIEYSNETWHGGFSSTSYVNDQGRRHGFGSGAAAGAKFTSYRSAQIWKIFYDTYGTTAANARVVKVIASQAGNADTGDQRLKAFHEVGAFKNIKHNGQQVLPDALAIAPYYANRVANNQGHWGGQFHNVFRGLKRDFTRLNAAGRVTKIINETRDSLTKDVRDYTGAIKKSVTKTVRENKTIANKHNVHLINYEGGSHLVAGGGASKNNDLTQALAGAHRDNRMGSIEAQYLNILRDNGVSLHTQFNHSGASSSVGSWGLMEHQNQGTPRYYALKSWSSRNNPGNLAPNARAGRDITQSSGRVRLDGSNSHDLDGTIQNLYIWKENGREIGRGKVITRTFSRGTHNVTLSVKDNRGRWNTDTRKITIGNGGPSNPGTGTQTLYQLGRSSTAGVTGSALLAGWGTQVRKVGNAYESRGKNANAGSNTPRTLRQALDHGEYTKFTMTPPSGKKLDIRNAEIKITIKRKSNWLSPKKYTLYAKTATGWVHLKTATNTSTSAKTYTFGNVNNSKLLTNRPIEFRLYAYEGRWANSWNSSGNITNIVAKGKLR